MALAVDKREREQLKHDVFVEEVKHGLDYASTHRKQLVLFAGIAAVVLILAGVWWWWSERQTEQRQAELREALTIQQAAVGPGASPFLKTYPTLAEKTAAIRKTFSEMAAKYPSHDAGSVANYYLGVSYADEGNYGEAEKYWQKVVDGGSKEYGALARFSLAQLYSRQGKKQDAERHLRYLIDNPAAVVSAENATIELAKLLAPTKPEEAQKLLEPLRQMSTRTAVSRWAISAYGDTKSAPK